MGKRIKIRSVNDSLEKCVFAVLFSIDGLRLIELSKAGGCLLFVYYLSTKDARRCTEKQKDRKKLTDENVEITGFVVR